MFGLNGHQKVGVRPLKAGLVLASFLVGFGFSGTGDAAVSTKGTEDSTFTNWLNEEALRSVVSNVQSVTTEWDMSGKNAAQIADGNENIDKIAVNEDKMLYVPDNTTDVMDVSDTVMNSGEQEPWHAKPVSERKYGSMRSPWVEKVGDLSEAEKALINGDINAYLDFDDTKQAVVVSPSYGRAFGNEQDVDVYPITVGGHTAFDDLWDEREEAADWAERDNALIGNDVEEVGSARSVSAKATSVASEDDLFLDFIGSIDKEVASVNLGAGDGTVDLKVAEDVPKDKVVDNFKQTVVDQESIPAVDSLSPNVVPVEKFGAVPNTNIVPVTGETVSSSAKTESKISLDAVAQKSEKSSFTLEIEPVVSGEKIETGSEVPVLIPQPVVASQPLLLPATQSRWGEDKKVEDYYPPFGTVDNSVMGTNVASGSQNNVQKTNDKPKTVNQISYSNSVKQSNASQRIVVYPSASMDDVGAQVKLGPYEQISFIFTTGLTNFSLDNVKNLKAFAKQILAEGKTKAEVILASKPVRLQLLRFAVIRAVLVNSGFDAAHIMPLLNGNKTDEVVVRAYTPKRHLSGKH